jgi:hypothetical protein
MKRVIAEPSQQAARFRAPIAASLGLACALFVGGCGDIRTVAGRPYDTSVLETSLVVGQSSREDVLAVLRQPDGVGRYYSPVEQQPLVMWSYNYEHGTFPKSLNRNLLFVLFRDGKYDGYLWFSDTVHASGG